MEQLCEVRLAQVLLLPATPEAVRQPQPQLHIGGLLIRQAKELLSGSEPPTLRFQPLLPASMHRRIPSIASDRPPRRAERPSPFSSAAFFGTRRSGGGRPRSAARSNDRAEPWPCSP